eukprot:superscaffoldBa00001573_g11144
MSELKDCPPLKYYDFKPVEHVKVCPRYTAVLGRSEDDGIGIEELDTLQLELETLLSSASRRLRALEEQRQILTDWQDKKGDKRFLKLGKDPDPAASSRHKPKKQKLDGKGGHGPGPGPGRPKSKNLQPKVQEYEFTDDPQDIPRTPKNDAPNRFWASVEPYCADITNEEIRLLEELLKPPEDEADVPHTRSLEARIKEELVAQGLLDSEERPGPGGDSEDEVLAELQKRQAELKALSAHNRARKQELLRLAKEEMRKQELRQRVRVSDNEVMEGFRRIMAARQKKRTPTKKEKDQAWKALKERESILKLLDG